MTKLSSLIILKVTFGDLDSTSKIFGPAQTAVSRAVADTVEDGYIPEDIFEDIVEDIIINVSAFIDPSSEDYRKIYQ